MYQPLLTFRQTGSRAGRALILLLAGFLITSALPLALANSSPNSAFHQNKLQEIDAAINNAIAKEQLPGAVLWLEHDGAVYHRTYGRRMVYPETREMIPDAIFDAASLTKVVATTPSILLLAQRNQVDLDAPVSTYIPEFTGAGRESITVEHLLTHTSGLRPGISPRPAWSGTEKAIQLACNETPRTLPGSAFRYSDINFILLGEIVARVSGLPLHEFAEKEIYHPLQMHDTMFLPPHELNGRIAPTERQKDDLLHGTVHDPTSRRMGGVAGHAGLFTSASDLARYARMLLNQGKLGEVRILEPETVQLMTKVHTAEETGVRRGLGWDIDSGYSRPRGKLFPIGSFGHTGWTGTSIWIDPFSQTFLIFLSNRNHPTEAGSVLKLRGTIGTLAAEAIKGFNFIHVPGALPPRPQKEETASDSPSKPGSGLTTTQVLNGIDLLEKENFRPLHGLKVGLITNHTGHDRQRRSTIDLLHGAPEVQLVALFSPEHGIRGLLDEKVSDATDEQTGLPIYSLYGETRKPTAEHLQGLDALLFDIQDIGCRFYTYISTMGLAMEAAADAGIQFIVLDRANPISGTTIDGPVLQGNPNFVGFHALPVRHGMTVGELARMFQKERDLEHLELKVVQVQNWQRDFWFDQTMLPWTNPSPNMRSLTEATLYPGVGLLETTKLSVGRGTDTPFERIGAPYIDDIKLAAELNAAQLRGLRFTPIRFTPNASVFKDQECGGVFIILTDRDQADILELGILVATILHRDYPEEFNLDRFNTLLFHPPTIEAIKAGKSLQEIRQLWSVDLYEFKNRRNNYLLY